MCLGRLTVDWDELPKLFSAFSEPGRWLPLLKRHHELLLAAAEHTRVSSVPAGQSIQRHYAESLEIWRIGVEGYGRVPASVADVGSGGGFPGMVIACLEPDLPIVLIEPLQKRARLLEAMAQELVLGNVAVHAVRAEDSGHGPLRDRCELVTARAVAPLAELLEYTVPLAAPGGSIVLPKGSGLEREIEATGSACAAPGARTCARTSPRRAGSASRRRSPSAPRPIPPRPIPARPRSRSRRCAHAASSGPARASRSARTRCAPSSTCGAASRWTRSP